ncbi:DUF6456 domain-containing protein [Hyphomicrobium sp.]|uniref:DUF6456 domain-containing protein n=1 Tax=Hyphomicrobium sp. TaxID=82 RepID=UPI0025C64FFA|nr:DUF6456 domain-containing protein [Hyphomicrobium sp.]MCC7252349.1 DNA replication protein [Hyphomicrobium sp.]
MSNPASTRLPKAPVRAPRTRKAHKPAADRALPVRNIAESPIAWLFNRPDRDGNPLISEAQFNAGEKLRADFWFAQMQPSVTQSWSLSASAGAGRRSAPGTGVELADNVIAAGERVRRALSAVGPELSGILIDVCCHLKGLEDAERKAGWPQRSGKIVLGVALSALARHYGFTSPAAASTPHVARVRHWGTADYRPAIDGTEDAADGALPSSR